MISGKERSYLKSIANNLETIMQIGKNGISDNLLTQLDEALEAREIVKVKILNNALLDTKETANEICSVLNAEFVMSIGNKFVLYRKSDKKLIEFPK